MSGTYLPGDTRQRIQDLIKDSIERTGLDNVRRALPGQKSFSSVF